MKRGTMSSRTRASQASGSFFSAKYAGFTPQRPMKASGDMSTAPSQAALAKNHSPICVSTPLRRAKAS